MHFEVDISPNKRWVLLEVSQLGTTMTMQYGKTDAAPILENLKDVAKRMEDIIAGLPAQLDVREEALLNAREAMEEAFKAVLIPKKEG
jgi:hypothetical protein